MSQQTVDLTNCDREPIHIPGSIQPHGMMLVLDVAVQTVLRHSINAGAMLGFAGPINGQPGEALLGRKVMHDLRNALAAEASATRAALLPATEVSGRLFDIAVHRHKGNVIVELEAAEAGAAQPLQLARAIIGRIIQIQDIDRLVQQAARHVRGTLGYDRVMIYQFERDGSGKVIAEAKRADLESFRGQYFPASDIPQQARALYIKNTIRIISSSSYQAVPVEPVLDLSGEPLDLSFAHLRSVSPIHLEYLRNMGVGASMSISILVDGQLWGLIACHHYSPRTLSMPLRIAAEMFGEFFSMHLGALRQRIRLDTATVARQKLDQMLARATGNDANELLRDSLPDLASLIECDGYGMILNGEWRGFGVTPDAAQVEVLVRYLGTVADGRVWATHSLASHLPQLPSGAFAGVLAVPLSQLPRDYLLFFRRELVQTLDWAGNPEKSYETGPMGDRLTPRKSFAIWKQEVHEQARPWSEPEREIAEAVRTALVEIVLRQNELLADERLKAEVRQRMLNEELNHRVKNILAIIKSLVGQPVREGRDLADYVASLKGRIQALSYAHDQVIRGEGGGSLAELIEAEVTPYRAPDIEIRLDGGEVWLDARAFSVMALVLHELATNAAKYGALSRAGGRLTVEWSIGPDGACAVTWQERGGPRVSPPSREGFGTYLLDRSVPYDLDGSSDISFAPDGLVARFSLPGKHVTRVGKRGTVSVAAAEPAGGAAADGLDPETRILLLEDQMLIAMDIESALNERGYGAVTTTNSPREALSVLDRVRPQAAILDINLGDTTSIPVAEELHRRQVPFVFATGYAEGDSIPPAFADVPVVRKPYDVHAILAALARLVRKG